MSLEDDGGPGSSKDGKRKRRADLCFFATGDFSHLASIFILLHKIVQLKVRFSSPVNEVAETDTPAELLGHLVQIANAVPAGLRHTIPWYAP